MPLKRQRSTAGNAVVNQCFFQTISFETDKPQYAHVVVIRVELDRQKVGTLPSVLSEMTTRIPIRDDDWWNR